ncbi:uncharacterized protein LOC135196787 [Macrobrachium nipponense]|uniref:uncharacterized protein LOC135196787 n=1 Tax=Macrobrachium nipponense TaxID=159736 RepID=UPI0030C8BB1D
MRACRLLVVFLCTLWKTMIPASDAVITNNRFFALPHIPTANVEMVLPYAKSTLQCFGACASHQPSCQGFVVNSVDLTQPCKLLIGLTGLKNAATPNTKAYVTRIIDGQVIHYNATRRTWADANAYCAGLNKQLIRPATVIANAVVLEAMNPLYIFVGALTDLADPNLVRDLYDNQQLGVTWASWRRYLGDPKKYMAYVEGAFEDINDYWTPSATGTICMPKP